MVESLNVPVPELFQRTFKYPEAVEPANVYVLPSQMVAVGPANAWVASLMVSSIWSKTSAHGLLA